METGLDQVKELASETGTGKKWAALGGVEGGERPECREGTKGNQGGELESKLFYAVETRGWVRKGEEPPREPVRRGGGKGE